MIYNLSKLSRQPIDFILCSNAEQIKVLSSTKLLKCIKTRNGKTFFCHNRAVTHFRHESNRCSRLSDSIIMELSTHRIMLKTNMKSIQIECGDVKEIIHINKTYAIIDLNPNCKIISDEFTVHEIKENSNDLPCRTLQGQNI